MFNFTFDPRKKKCMAQPRDLYNIGPFLLGWLFLLLPWTLLQAWIMKSIRLTIAAMVCLFPYIHVILYYLMCAATLSFSDLDFIAYKLIYQFLIVLPIVKKFSSQV